MYIALVLAVLTGAEVSSPAQKQHAAAAAYRLSYHLTATGSFTTVVDQTTTITGTVDIRDFVSGTAFAVDSDGWLMTARHVADMEWVALGFCETAWRRYTRFQVDRVQLDATLADIVGNNWHSRFIVTPSAGPGQDVCNASELTVQHDAGSFTVEKLDDTADLALIKLTQPLGAVAALAWGAVADLREWYPVYAFGYPGDHLTMRRGAFLLPCEFRLIPGRPMPALGPDVVEVKGAFLTRYLMDGKPGMSGGPVIAGERVVGVACAMLPRGHPEAGSSIFGVVFAVPGDYAHAWYLWARGLSPDSPAAACEPPPDFEGEYMP